MINPWPAHGIPDSPIAGTTDDKLYRTGRIGTGAVFGYNLPVANGTYDVTLQFAETQHDQRLRRIFDVALEGTIVLDDLDLFAAAGGKDIAYDVTRRVSVGDGNLDVDFIKVVGYPKINAILVRTADVVTAASFSSDAGSATSARSAAPQAANIEPAADGRADNDSGAENARDEEPSCRGRDRACPATRVYEIRYMAFVPANHVRLDSPAATCRTRAGALAPLVFSGDDRGFDAAAHLRRRYRVLQRALIVERTGTDGRPRFSLASSETVVRPDLAFRAGNHTDPIFRGSERLPLEADTRDQLGDCNLLHARGADRSAHWQDPRVIGRTSNAIKLAFRSMLRHGLLPDLMPQTAWDFTVNIDASTSSPRITVRGWHTGFPAHELYANNQPLTRYSPFRSHKLPTLRLDPIDPQWQYIPLRTTAILYN